MTITFMNRSFTFLPNGFSEEKKVRRYLDDNFTNRPELISPIPGHKDDHEAELGSLKKQQYKGTGPKTRDGEQSLKRDP